MNANRIRLINAARKALFQREQLKRSADSARLNFAPHALQARAKSTARRTLAAGAEAAEDGLRKYALPLGLTALAGLAFAFRRPLGAAATVVAAQTDHAAKTIADFIATNLANSPPTDTDKEQPDEPI